MSSYQTFPVLYEVDQDSPLPVGAGVEVYVRAEGEIADEAESPLTTDSNGEIVAGTLAGVAAGTTVFFRIEEFAGMAGSIAQITT